MTAIERQKDLSGAILDPNTFMLIQLLGGNRYVGHLCLERPRDRREMESLCIARGLVGVDGGMFRCFRSGWIRCVAYIVEGRLVISTPQLVGQWVEQGQLCRLGPIVTKRPA